MQRGCEFESTWESEQPLKTKSTISSLHLSKSGDSGYSRIIPPVKFHRPSPHKSPQSIVSFSSKSRPTLVPLCKNMIIFRHGVASQINALPGPDPKSGRALLNQRTIIYFLGYRSKHVFESVLHLLCNCPSAVQSLFCSRWEPIVPNLSREKWLP